MLDIKSDLRDLIFTAEFTFEGDETPIFSNKGEEMIFSIVDIEGVEYLKDFSYTSTGSNNRRYLDTFYRTSRGDGKWTEFLELNEGEILNFPPTDPLDKLFIEVKFIRNGDSLGDIKLNGFKLIGEIYSPKVDLLNDVYAVIPGGEELVIKPPYIYKVFRLDSFGIDISPENSDYEIFWKFSQDNSRSWTKWEPLTNENLSTKRINPIRFFQIQYLVKNNGNDDLKLYEINLFGDFQNVSLDNNKVNLFGIRECCPSQGDNMGDNCDNFLNNPLLTEEQKSKLFNPYNQGKSLKLLNKMSNDVLELFGHKVQYLVTDPDGNGIDYSLHEFGLFNIVCQDMIKVTVDNNQFPDNQIKMNEFDLSLFDSFQIQITKEVFKDKFGLQRRPSKEDIVYFCDLNRIFIVDHSQQFRSFNNYSVYYNIVLKKYNTSANVKPGNQSIEDRIKQLTNNSTVDILFGNEMELDKKATANKDQTRVLSKDPIRLEITGFDVNKLVVRSLLENSTTVISKNYYDLSSSFIPGRLNSINLPLIKYKNSPKTILVSDNLSFTCWFRINNIIDGEIYNLYEHYDSNSGIKINIMDNKIHFKINDVDDIISEEIEFFEEVWYSILVNLDQRMRVLTISLKTRNVDPFSQDESKYLKDTKLKSVYRNDWEIVPTFYDLESDAVIKSSDMYITNIRLFSDVIPIEEEDIISNQYLVSDDSRYLIFADNANLKLTLPNFKYN